MREQHVGKATGDLYMYTENSFPNLKPWVVSNPLMPNPLWNLRGLLTRSWCTGQLLYDSYFLLAILWHLQRLFLHRTNDPNRDAALRIQFKLHQAAIALSIKIAEQGKTLAEDAIHLIPSLKFTSDNSQSSHSKPQFTIEAIQTHVDDMLKLAEGAQKASLVAHQKFRDLWFALWEVYLSFSFNLIYLRYHSTRYWILFLLDGVKAIYRRLPEQKMIWTHFPNTSGTTYLVEGYSNYAIFFVP